MKKLTMLFVILLIGCSVAPKQEVASAQSSKPSTGHDIDWKDCQQVTKQWETQVQGFNAKHAASGDGLEIQLGCLYSNPEPKKPQRKIALTKQEAASLKELRLVANRVFSSESKYEDDLIKAHGVAKPSYGDPCWYFVGIIFDEYSITVDPNMSMPGCNMN